MGRENRLHPRVLARLSAEACVDGSAGWIRGLLHDLSVSGAGLLTESQLAPASVRLRFRLPADAAGAEPVELRCLVVRGGRLALPDEGLHHLSGLHFLPLTDEVHEKLEVYVRTNMHREAP